MALKSSCVLVHRTVTRDGTIILEFAKQVTNGETVLSSEPNLMSVGPVNGDGSPVNWVKVRAQLDSHMGELGFDPVSDADWAMVTDFAAANAVAP